jgi:Glycosyltransferase
MKKKILWVSPDCFADCDIPYVPSLLDEFDIYWLIFLPVKGSRYRASDFTSLGEKYDNLTVKVIQSTLRERDPRKVFEYFRIIRSINTIKPDVIYCNAVPASPWQIPMFISLPKKKTIVTAHQGRVHVGMGHYWYYNFLRDIVYRRIKNVNMFSKSQADLFKQRYSSARVFQWPLGLKYFGETTVKNTNDGVVKFLSFGSINFAKHIDLFLDAANIVYERGYKDIKVIIRGWCQNWHEYKSHIKYPDIVDEDIRMINNSEIPDLFTNADYFVQPYRVVSQSGPFKIALRYNLPLITSDLPGFADEMVENTTGFMFKNNEVESLVNIMIKAIKLKKNIDEYQTLKFRMNEYVDDNYSEAILVKQYSDMFNEVMKEENN